MDRDLPGETPPLLLPECIYLMNSSVTQLIAKPVTNLSAASSPLDPAAGLLRLNMVCVTQPASPEQRVGEWVAARVHLCTRSSLILGGVKQWNECEHPVMEIKASRRE